MAKLDAWTRAAHFEHLRLELDTLEKGCPANELQATLDRARKHLEILERAGEDMGSWRMAYDRLCRELED